MVFQPDLNPDRNHKAAILPFLFPYVGWAGAAVSRTTKPSENRPLVKQNFKSQSRRKLNICINITFFRSEKSGVCWLLSWKQLKLSFPMGVTNHQPTTDQAWEKSVPPASPACKGLSHRTEVLAKCPLLAATPRARQSIVRSFTPSKVLHNSLHKHNCTKAIHAGVWAFVMHYYKFGSTSQNFPFYFTAAKIWHFHRAIRNLSL